ncbi:MAG: hypothetical protein A2Z77_04030 [Chloroflexi bacterium RBG_13_51_36]|nr:MAG: hypothetical protein A2Z77_04030 [Chloroflexi bacterium RBG_13_51_36]
MNNENWQIPHIKKALDYHNRSYDTDFAIAGRCEQFFPGLQGGWDWACSTTSGSRGAIEVKRLTDEYKHEAENVLRQISDSLEEQLSGRIPGLYRLLLTIWDQPLDLNGDKKEKSEKIKKLKKTLLKVVEDSANTGVREAVDLSEKIREYLPDVVSNDFEASLQRIPSGESRLVIELQTGGDAPSVVLEGNQFDKFKALVQKANEQLYKAKSSSISDTFLITLDLLYHLAAPPDVIKNTFHMLSFDDHCNIDYVYHVGSSVTRIKP